ncbi:MAG: ABC transporter permease [Candidatus Acidiferrales bacterium]
MDLWRKWFSRKSWEQELSEELRDHIEKQTALNISAGMKPDQARREARLQFGAVEGVKEDCREERRGFWLETLWADARYGLRMLRKNPGFTTVAILTLALGIGANTAIFSVVNAVLLRPLPFRDPARLTTVLENKPSQGLEWLYVTPNNFIEWQRRATAFESIAASTGCGFRIGNQTDTHFIPGSCVSSSFLPMLGIHPVLGRLWTPEEDVTGRDHVVVVSYGLWQSQFGGDPGVIGKTIQSPVGREPYTIIGVLPPDFQFATEDVAAWAPLAVGTDDAFRRSHSLMVFARLKQGTTIEQAQASMEAIGAQLQREFPQTNTGWGVTVWPMQQFYSTQGNTRTILLVLLAAVGSLLLIACANIANLLLARATSRQREIAVRIAIGASRLRLVRQLLTESLLLGLLGGAAGFLLAWAAFGSLLSIAPTLPSFKPHAFRIDFEVFVFSMIASLLASIFFGLTPALRSTKQDLNESLREAGRGAHATVRDRWARHVLVVAEIGSAVVILIGTGLLLKSFWNLENDRLGFASDHVLTMRFCCLDQAHFPAQQQVNAFYRNFFDRLRTLPGVEAATATTGLPLRQFDGGGSVFVIQGRPVPEPGHETLSDFRFVEPDFFHTMKIPPLRGRVFSPQDDEEHAPVAVINETLARRHFPNQDPIGQQIQMVLLQPFGRWFTVIGMVANSRDRGMGRETRSTIYLSEFQNEVRGGALLIRTKSDPHMMEASVREVIRSANPDISTANSSTLDEALVQSISPQRFSVILLTLFAALALSLASVGVYGVTAYAVAQRTHEIGVRIALGALPRDVMLLVIGQGARLALAGVIVGLTGAFALMRLMTSLLFGVSPYDPLTILIVCAGLTCVTLLACYVPARRAMRVDPMIALRYE